MKMLYNVGSSALLVAAVFGLAWAVMEIPAVDESVQWVLLTVLDFLLTYPWVVVGIAAVGMTGFLTALTLDRKGVRRDAPGSS